MRQTGYFAPLVLAAAIALPALAADPQGYKGLGVQSIAPETLAKYGPRPFDPELKRKIEAMLDVRAPGLGIVAPGAKRLFFGWNVTGTNQVWRADGPDRFPVQLTGGEDVTGVADVTPDGKTLVIQRDRKGEENPGVYLQPADGGALRPVQHKPGVQTFAQFVSDDGRWLYYAANDVRPDAYALYRYDLAAGKAERILDAPGLWSIDDHRPDGTLLLRKSTGSLSAEYFEWTPGGGEPKPLFGQGESEEYVARFGPAPGEVLVLTPKFGEFRRLHTWRAGKFTPATPDLKWDVNDFSIDPARKRVLYTVNEGGYTRLHARDAKTGAPLRLPDFKGADHVYAGYTTRDGRYTTLGVEMPTAPRTAYVLDWETGKLTRWVTASTPEIDTRRFAVPTLEHYPARDGTKIPMFVRRPAGCGDAPCPVIVDFHGGPEGQSTAGFSAYAQLFVDAGFVFVEPNVRGSDGYGKTWLDADNGTKRLDVITDIEDCAKHIRAAWAVGGKAPKIGISGGSYGGYSTLIGMTMFAGAYDAGVSNVGISNLVTFLENTAPYRRILRTTEYGDPATQRDVLLKLSPITYVERVRAPLFIIQGASDPRVPVGEAIQVHDALAARGVPVDLLIFADEGHGAAKRENRVQTIGHTLLFFIKHLKG